MSYAGRRAPVDDAVKIAIVEAADGLALVAYAGLGATARGVQPSQWITNMLRGRRGLSVEECLGVIANVATREMPRHIVRLPGASHSFVAAAFIKDVGARIYTIDNYIDLQRRKHWHRYTSHQTQRPGRPPPRIVVAGSGGPYLMNQGREWQRALIDLARASDRGQISAGCVADELARLNAEAAKNTADGSVGERCIVAWRRRRDAQTRGPGGAHRYYTGETQDRSSPQLPTVTNGLDLSAVIEVIAADLSSGNRFSPGLVQDLNLDVDAVNTRLSELPAGPDERLR